MVTRWNSSSAECAEARKTVIFNKKGAAGNFRPLPFFVRPSSDTLFEGYIIPAFVARIELTRAADLLGRVLDHFRPLGDPAHGAGEGEDGREHAGGEAHGLENDARIEVHIGVELLLDEIFVLEGDLLQFHGDLE